jgi:RibD C-terminal domain
MGTRSRLTVAAFQMSLDGYMQGPNGEVDWVDSWTAARDLISDVDACVLGGGMYPGYEQLWGSVARDPQTGTAMLGRAPSDAEVGYARWARRTPHYVLSTTLEKLTGRTPASCVASTSFAH